MTIAAYTLGCKVNQYDTEAILKDFINLGFTVCDFNKKADVYFINTCTVTNTGSKKSRQAISRAKRLNPGAFIVAYGCYAKTDPEVLQNISGVSLVIPPGDKHRAAKIISDNIIAGHDILNKDIINEPPVKRTRAYIKIQDGCDRFCSYCIVPYARGGVVSRTIGDVITEAKSLVYNGTKEIIITGIQIAAYGNDFNSRNKADLPQLIKLIHDIKGLKRLRLSSIEPNLTDDYFLSVIGKLPKLCDHFHLSLQSGCDRTLAAMNRRYTAEQFEKAATGLRCFFPQASLTTDVIVGFPGETDEDFNETMKFVEKIGFLKIHAFPYSRKTKTPAACFPNQINGKVKKSRCDDLKQLAEKMNTKITERYIGKTFPVLFETEKENGIWEGCTTHYIKVRVKSPGNLKNKIISVKLNEQRCGVVCGVLED